MGSDGDEYGGGGVHSACWSAQDARAEVVVMSEAKVGATCRGLESQVLSRRGDEHEDVHIEVARYTTTVMAREDGGMEGRDGAAYVWM